MQTRRSLYLRLMLASLAPMVLASACAFLIALAVFTRTLDERARAETEHAAQVLAESDLPLTAELLHRFSALQRCDFYLLDSAGRVALTTRGQVPAELARAIGALTPARPTARLSVGGAQMVAALAAFDGQDRRFRELIAVSSLADARLAARRAAVALAAAVLASTVLLALLVRVLMGQITRPLTVLAGVARSIGSGRRGLQVPIERQDELGDLARAFNEMVQRIERYESRLAEQSRLSALGEMAARLAHEVRNPLTGLKMHLQLLAERSPHAETERMRLLLNEVRRLELVVDASLMLARGRKPEFVPADLSALVGEIIDLMRPTLEHRSIELRCRLEATPALSLDRALVKQAVLNLLVNAADALPVGGWITVNVSCETGLGAVLLSVEDSGSGFTTEVLASQGKIATSTKALGLGLGLTVCREVAELHGGELALGSAARGGARVTLHFPLPAAHDSPLAAPEPNAASAEANAASTSEA